MAKKKTEPAPSPRPRAGLLPLIEACKADPNDDAARLVLADWLEEHGDDSDRERAAFVRLEVTTGMERGLPVLEVARHVRWNRIPWLGWVPWVRRAAKAFQGRTCLDHALIGASLDATNLGEADARAVAGSEAWAWVASVWNCTPQTDLPRFLDSPILVSAPGVIFAQYHLRPADCAVIARHPRAGTWRDLRFASCLFDRGSLAPLLRSDHLAGLRSLSLGASVRGKDQTEMFSPGTLPRLESLQLRLANYASSGPVLRDASFRLRRLQVTGRLADALSADAAAALTDLDCSDTRLSARAVTRFQAAPFLAGLRSLRLARCQLRHCPPHLLASFRALDSLLVLDLSSNGLCGSEIVQLVRSPVLAGLTYLNLSDNRIGREGATGLTASETAPLALNLTGCDIGDEGLERLAAWPGLSRCRVLWLGRNSLADRGIEALARSAHAAGLRSLSLNSNPDVGDAGMEWLIRSPLGDQLEELKLGGTQAGAGAARALLATGALGSIRELELDHTLENDWWAPLRERFADLRGFSFSLPF